MKAYKKIPVINEFRDADGNDIMQQQIDRQLLADKGGRVADNRRRDGKNKK